MHFNDVFQGTISVYTLINGEDWHQIMYALVRSARANDTSEMIPKAYCVFALILGNFTLLALFTGTLL